MNVNGVRPASPPEERWIKRTAGRLNKISILSFPFQCSEFLAHIVIHICEHPIIF